MKNIFSWALLSFLLIGCGENQNSKAMADYVAVYFKQYTREAKEDRNFYFSGKRKYEKCYLFQKDYVLRYDDYRVQNIQGIIYGCYFYRTPFYLDFDAPQLKNSLDENGRQEIILNRGMVFYFDSY